MVTKPLLFPAIRILRYLRNISWRHHMKRSRIFLVLVGGLPLLAQAIFGDGQADALKTSNASNTAVSATAPLSAPFIYKVLSTMAEAPLPLRFFSTAVKTDSRGRVVTGPTSDPVKNIVGPEAAGERGGLLRFTKIMFGAGYIDGRPDPGTRIDPNNPRVRSGNQMWPNRQQPFRSEPRALSLTPDARKLYVALPGREGYPDWRVAAVDTVTKRVIRWIDLRPNGQA